MEMLISEQESGSSEPIGMLSVESQIHIPLLKSITIKAWVYAPEIDLKS